MNQQSFALNISPDIGAVTAAYIVPEKRIGLVTLTHGAGAGMDHPFMTTLANALSAVGIITLRFNFPFMENKKKRVDVPAVAHQTIEAAVHHAHEAFPSLPLFVSGKSFGGRMSSQYLSLNPIPYVRGIIFYGFPLHPAGKPSIDRAEHLKAVSIPMLFLQGTRDELATLSLVEDLCSKLATATLVKIEGADHAFKAGKQDTIKPLADNTIDWMNNLLNIVDSKHDN
ncbi:alpha/beta family hydrolase [Segetibacter sp.]|uniref:alpha/beta hydrolase family protein n=1 Tax=Segetibacter sp. TaxID=2231182 RepID=UPI002617076A|nr:alpha/beta family hydrolase [Segetibacter sp.]